MFLRSFKLSLIFLVFIAASAFAGTLTLKEAVEAALKQNPEITSAKAEWESTKAKIPQALALDDPRLGLEYEQIPSGSRNPEDGMKMYTAEQMIMFPGKIYAEWQMARAEAEAAGANYKAKALEIAAQVKSAYYELFLADRAIEVIGEIRDFLLKIKKSAEAKYVVGDVVQSDVLMANIEYLMMDNELVTRQQERPVKEEKLKALLNRNDEVTIETEADLVLPGTIGSEKELEKAATLNRPELRAMKAELDAKDSAHFKSKMEFFPDTMLGVKKRAEDGWDAMISFSIPLYFWKQGYGVASVGLEKEAAEAAYQNMKNMTAWEVKEAWVMADSARRTVQLYEDKIVPQSAQALKAALAAYQAGKVDFQTFLNIERAYKEAKLKLFESRVKFGRTLAELDKIVGGELK